MSSPPAPAPLPPAPQALRVPYGEQQGSFLGIAACSNKHDGFFSGENNYVNHELYTGFRYQCVEYARRFLVHYTGCVFDNCGRASEIFRMDKITHVETGAEYPLVHHHNNTPGNGRPAPGDIIVYPFNEEQTPWGHVGVISYVDDHRVGIIEQNQIFTAFFSPNPSYLDGERCVARYAELIQVPAADGVSKPGWHIKENNDVIPDSFGWLSFPDAPRRPERFAPFKFLPSMLATRSTPLTAPDHPCICRLDLPNPIEVAAGSLHSVFALWSGAGEAFVGAGTASARVLRQTLQLLFCRHQCSSAFRLLPSNPFGATLPPAPKRGEGKKGVDEVMAALAALGNNTDNEEKAFPVLADYFGVPVEWIAAMQREFALCDTYMFMGIRLFACLPDDEGEMRAAMETRRKELLRFQQEYLEKQKRKQPTEAAAAAATPSSPSGTAPNELIEYPMANPKDALFTMAGLDFYPAPALLTAPNASAHGATFAESIQLVRPGVRVFGETSYKGDMLAYIRRVEQVRGPRSALTIVLAADSSNTERATAEVLADFCEQRKFPVRILAESDLAFVNGRLLARPTDASPPLPPASAAAGGGDAATTTDGVDLNAEYEVNLVYTFIPWHHILADPATETGRTHAALREAALHRETDVVFGVPLWSYLCHGLVSRVAGATGDAPLSVKFFDLARRLAALALPPQPYQTWDMEVSEFKGSCLRTRLIDNSGAASPYSATIPRVPPLGYEGNIVSIDFAGSAYVGLSHVELAAEDSMPLPPRAHMHPSTMCHMFPMSVDDE